jgi:outer membrane biosynthesis protein TonB
LTRSDRLRVAAAFAASLLAHVVVLNLLRLPPAAPPLPQGVRLNLLLIPIPGERRAETVTAGARSSALPSTPKGTKRAVPERPSQAAAPSAPELIRTKRPFVSAGPISQPAAAPTSRLPDAAAYLPPGALSAHPAFAAPFEMQFPRAALDEGRRAVVIVQLLIDEDGRVAEALAMPDAPEDFAAAALVGLRAARFVPAQAGGRPVKARAYFAVSFVLE